MFSSESLTVAAISAIVSSLVTYVVIKRKPNAVAKRATDLMEYSEHDPAGHEAKYIAASVPYFPFKGIPKFYDIGGFLGEPQVFKLVIDLFVKRYKYLLETGALKIDKIAGIDARGFILGPPLALALEKPFIMLRKKGKMPNTFTGEAYTKEYAGSSSLSIQHHALEAGENVLIVDDLIATGGSMLAAMKLVQRMGANVAECACIVSLQALGATERFQEEGFSTKVWYLLDEQVLTRDGLKDSTIRKHPDGYEDDGLLH